MVFFIQACVLLITQGDNSRIRGSATQERQHVLSADIRPYFKKLLDTSPALLQDVALPANFMFRNVSTLAPGFEAGVRLLQGGRRPSTVNSYDHKWLKFQNFTAQVQDDAGAPRMSALPASSQAVVAYLGYLLESGTISAKSLQPYMSAINAVHNDFNKLVVDSIGAYGSLSPHRSSTSTSLCGRLQKLSSSASCLRASIFLKRHTFDKLHLSNRLARIGSV
jgi:hypothetical protein